MGKMVHEIGREQVRGKRVHEKGAKKSSSSQQTGIVMAIVDWEWTTEVRWSRVRQTMTFMLLTIESPI